MNLRGPARAGIAALRVAPNILGGRSDPSTQNGGRCRWRRRAVGIGGARGTGVTGAALGSDWQPN